jgi:hypothetical protein
MGANNAMRDTWLPEVIKLGMSYKFFHGRNAVQKDDVVLVDCHDDYFDLTSKTKEKLKWALFQGYDFVFACFPDTYACAERLATCGYNNSDYFGTTHCHPGGNTYCQGGPGYFLSRKAMEVIVNDLRNYPNEDCFVADVLLGSGIRPTHNDGFRYAGPGPLKTNSIISNHLSTQPGGYRVQAMLREHENWARS